MAKTRWVWIPDGEARVLAFTYIDRMAGPSAKGRVVANPGTLEQIREAVDYPNRTFRQPSAFGAIPIGAEEALRLGLPKDPPWIGHLQGKPVPPPDGKPSRAVSVFVRRRGVPAAGARVRIGNMFGPGRELLRIDERMTDVGGRCEFPFAPCEPLIAIAVTNRECSRLVNVPDSGTVELALLPFGAIDGTVTRAGARARGVLRLVALDGGMLQWEHTDAVGRFRVEGLPPGRYEVGVFSIDPETGMAAGTPAFDEIVVEPGQTLRYDYDLVAGAAVRVIAAVEHERHSGDIYLFAGARTPRDSTELHALWQELDRTRWCGSSGETHDGKHQRCRFLDVVPGTYTLCVLPSTRHGDGHNEQPAVCREITVGAEDVTVEITVPPLRPR